MRHTWLIVLASHWKQTLKVMMSGTMVVYYSVLASLGRYFIPPFKYRPFTTSTLRSQIDGLDASNPIY